VDSRRVRTCCCANRSGEDPSGVVHRQDRPPSCPDASADASSSTARSATITDAPKASCDSRRAATGKFTPCWLVSTASWSGASNEAGNAWPMQVGLLAAAPSVPPEPATGPDRPAAWRGRWEPP